MLSVCHKVLIFNYLSYHTFFTTTNFSIVNIAIMQIIEIAKQLTQNDKLKISIPKFSTIFSEFPQPNFQNQLCPIKQTYWFCKPQPQVGQTDLRQ